MRRRGRWLAATGVGVVAVAVVLVVTLLIVGGAFMPCHYLEPWDKDYHKRFTDPRMQVVAHALLASSGHNMQPWCVALGDEVSAASAGCGSTRTVADSWGAGSGAFSFRLFADGQRTTSQVDPFARQHTISQGTFLEYARVAAHHLGLHCEMTLFPEGEYDGAGSASSMARRPVADVRLSTAVHSSQDADIVDDFASVLPLGYRRKPSMSACSCRQRSVSPTRIGRSLRSKRLH